MTDELIIKSLSTLEDLQEVQRLEILVWGMDCVPTHQTITAVKNGGLVLGGYINGQLVGFQYSFPGFKDGRVFLCSHMLAIHPDHQKKGYGRLLKLAQKEEALKKGYDLITWTYDPLESVNANLNIGKLKAVCSTYMEDCYGEMKDALNEGLSTDRFMVEWNIRQEANEEPPLPDKATHIVTTGMNDQGFPYIKDYHLKTNADVVAIPIPTDIQKIKKGDLSLAIDWRSITGELFKTLFAKGYVAVGIAREQGEDIQNYLLKKQE
ncbi:GNAT family N-acetyltransferase [Peribacillus sp. NJ11]|uniref:GNAT family N-acetyltransferase n=1 Tax=Peribacillus TaxID=2675229 RepID=UPI0025A15214|nr:GNAT family N-acetyltransferase [Peribacillus sp. NJ11]MDM5219353.1 GNAT family N-acetyltransferase [Peribacillus sp. NJ11]